LDLNLGLDRMEGRAFAHAVCRTFVPPDNGAAESSPFKHPQEVIIDAVDGISVSTDQK
jgi:hypothetical protein